MTTIHRKSQPAAQHILLLGASGLSGLAFIREHLALPDISSKPYLTLYTRSSGRLKLTSLLPTARTSDTPASKIRIIEGDLSDAATVRNAFSADGRTGFPKVTAVISLLGAYPSLYHFLTRTTPTPIANAFKSTIIPAMREVGVRRVLVLSTPTAFLVPGEREKMSWGWWFHNLIPAIAVPQGNAEMKGIAEAVVRVRGGRLEVAEGLDVTVFRVPFLEDGEIGKGVIAFELGGVGATENKALNRGGMAKWLLKELDGRKWVGRAPMLCNAE